MMVMVMIPISIIRTIMMITSILIVMTSRSIRRAHLDSVHPARSRASCLLDATGVFTTKLLPLRLAQLVELLMRLLVVFRSLLVWVRLAWVVLKMMTLVRVVAALVLLITKGLLHNFLSGKSQIPDATSIVRSTATTTGMAIIAVKDLR